MIPESIVAIRVSRRALAAAMIDDERLIVADGFHLNSRRDRAERSSERYVERLVTRMPIKGVVIHAPNTDESASSAVLRTVQTTLVRAGISIRLISKTELLRAFGQPPLQHWTQLRACAEGFWPELANVKSAAKPYIVDAAAVALYAESLLALIPTRS